MHIYKLPLTLLLTAAFAINSALAFATADSSEITPSTKPHEPMPNCLSLINLSIDETKDIKLFMNPAFVGIDVAVINGSVALALPTAFAALPAGATLLAARTLGASTYKEAKQSSQERARQIILDAVIYKQPGAFNDENLATYPALQELVTRVNGPVNTLLKSGYSADTVAELVIKATQDSNFCENSNNFRMVHFKDYVLTHVGDVKKKQGGLWSMF